MLDILFLFILSLVLLKIFFKSTKFHYSTNLVKRASNIKIEPNLEDNELKLIDQEKFLLYASDLVTKVWQAFSLGDMEYMNEILIKDSVKRSISAKMSMYSKRATLLKQISYRIKSITKNDDSFFIETTFINELRDASRTYKSIEDWSFTRKKTDSQWELIYVSAF
ncbi:hypothetical protein [Candidatus Gromoviella agglomerans]|uniref:hypothetical protein n=1 Tax=Candidatus Gromoviella agglomerans TaxID=2806609 RepID=UPI001E54FEAD|nr:hypothetical protein [Candidatus Gromoviella agglomerans]